LDASLAQEEPKKDIDPNKLNMFLANANKIAQKQKEEPKKEKGVDKNRLNMFLANANKIAAN